MICMIIIITKKCFDMFTRAFHKTFLLFFWILSEGKKKITVIVLTREYKIDTHELYV